LGLLVNRGAQFETSSAIRLGWHSQPRGRRPHPTIEPLSCAFGEEQFAAAGHFFCKLLRSRWPIVNYTEFQ
jgi:hypothetical protein